MSNGDIYNDHLAAQDGYLYDVFLSYSYKPNAQHWVHTRFYPKFNEWLDSALLGLDVDAPPEPGGRVCLAKRELRLGDVWPDALREQLRRSKVLVAICSPHYFRSEWCKIEWDCFRQREGNPRMFRLRLPLLYDGENEYLMPKIDNIESIDFREYIYTSPAMDKEPEGYRFERALKEFAVKVAAVVADAPMFDRGMLPVVLAPMPPPMPTPNTPFISL